MYKKINKCRICGNTELVTVVDLGSQFLTGVFPKTKTENVTKGPLILVKCQEGNSKDHCGLVQLLHSFEGSEMYGENYGYRSGLNSSMVRHLGEIVKQNLAFVKLQEGDLILDIASNDGTLLNFYPQEKYILAGIDPTALKFKKYYSDKIRIIPDFFSAGLFDKEFKGKKAKIITSIAMFYDLEDPLSFVQDIYNVLDDNGIWVFEQSYMPLMIERNAYDTICHEHIEYYGLQQVKWLLDKAGLKILDIEINDTNGGSFKLIVSKAGSSYQECTSTINHILSKEKTYKTVEPYIAFKNNIVKHKEKLTELLNRLYQEKKMVLGYGASTKGNVILQYCEINKELIPFIAEVNEDKFGCCTPGSHISIISEKEAKAMNPDYLLVLPWHFRENIIQREKEFLKNGGQLIFPLPEIEVV